MVAPRMPHQNTIFLKRPDDVRQMERNAQMLVWIVDSLAPWLVPGVTTASLDAAIRRAIENRQATAALLGYKGYPAATCMCLNDEVTQALPGDRVLRDGDLLNIQVALQKDGWYARLLRTFPIGALSPERQRLLQTTRQALREAIALSVPGANLGDISGAVETIAARAGFSVVREWVGHGIGRYLHEPPEIPSFRSPRRGPELREGMVLQYMPLLTAGRPRTTVNPGELTVRTADGADACVLGHTIAIEADGPRVLSFSPADLLASETCSRSLGIVATRDKLRVFPLRGLGLHRLTDAARRPILTAGAHLVQSPQTSPLDPAQLAAFENTLNQQELTLYDLQIFFEKHPDFFPETDTCGLRSTLILPQHVFDGDLPELLIEPVSDTFFEPTRMGLPFKSFSIDAIQQGRLAYYLHAAGEQIRRYLPFFDGTRYMDPIHREYGLRVSMPCMGIVIGPSFDLSPFSQRQLANRLPYVNTVTIDKLLAKARYHLKH